MSWVEFPTGTEKKDEAIAHIFQWVHRMCIYVGDMINLPKSFIGSYVRSAIFSEKNACYHSKPEKVLGSETCKIL